MAQVGQVAVFGGSGPPEPVTASVAVVSYPEDGITRDELVEAAEAGLAEAKREKVSDRSTSGQSLGWASQAG